MVIGNKNFGEAFKEIMEARGLTVEKLAALTGVPERYLAALRDGDFKKLPPAPYVRGYFTKIAPALGVDHELLWQIYKKESDLKTSGHLDKLPTNRFVNKPFNKKILIIGIVVISVIIYLIWRADDFLGSPEIEIVSPAANNLVFEERIIKLVGDISAGDKLTINGEEVLTDENGRFEKDFQLDLGINTAEFKVKRFLGKETTVIRQIIYQDK